MAYMPKLNHIASACALLFVINHAIAQSEAELSPVVVTGEKGTGYVAKRAMIGGPGGTEEVELKDVPASINVITKDLLDDRQVKLISEAARTDASIGDYYATLGYYENLSIRGIPLDFATSFRLNGSSIAGEQNFAFENKDRVEILKGVSAMQVGASSPGGVINFVTKRPKDVMSATVGTGERGTAYAAVDYGTFLNNEKSLGIRINAAHEDIRPYVKGAEGKRDFASLAVDAKIDNKTLMQFDIEYQEKKQRSVYGVTLLGGTTIPNIPADIMLNRYSWAEPVGIKSLNSTMRLDHEISDSLKIFSGVSYSKINISDKSAYPYGCVTEGNSTFCSNGDFNVYDYRINEERRNIQFQTGLNGKGEFLNKSNDWTLALTYFNRNIYRGSSIYADDGNGGWIDNIYTLNSTSVTGPSPGQPGTPSKVLDHKQMSLLLFDKVDLTEKIKIYGGGRYINMSEQTFDSSNGEIVEERKKNYFLPQLGSSYKFNTSTTFYISYSKGLELGTVPLPDSFANGNSILPPKTTTQYEAGLKLNPNQDLFATVAIFRATRPNEFASLSNSGRPYFLSTLLQEGKLTNTGIEGTLAYQATNRLRIVTSGMYIQAKQSGAISDPNQNGAQAIGIPHLKATNFVDYLLPGLENTSLQGAWTYVSSKGVTIDNSIKVPGYHKFDVGLKYIDKVGKSKATYRLNVENVFDKFYWRDVSQTYGSNTLYPGIPRIFRATATFDF